jgi:hypothetical protein
MVKTLTLLVLLWAIPLTPAAAEAKIEHTIENSASFPILKGPYFGQTPPGLTPEIFAHGIVSVDGRYEGGVSFSADFNEMYFSATVKGHSIVYFSKLENQHWTQPIKANFTQGKVADEFSPFASLSGNRIYFSTYDSSYPLKIWYVNRLDNAWSKAILLDSPLNNEEVIMSSEAQNGDLFYINSSKRKMYYARNNNNQFAEGQDVGIEYGSHGFISPSQDFLVVDAHKDNDETKDKDIYVYFKQQDGTWSKPINLGSTVNSNFREGSPTITPDGKYLFFNRYDEKSGNPNIYWVSTGIITELKKTNF